MKKNLIKTIKDAILREVEYGVSEMGIPIMECIDSVSVVENLVWWAENSLVQSDIEVLLDKMTKQRKSARKRIRNNRERQKYNTKYLSARILGHLAPSLHSGNTPLILAILAGIKEEIFKGYKNVR